MTYPTLFFEEFPVVHIAAHLHHGAAAAGLRPGPAEPVVLLGPRAGHLIEEPVVGLPPPAADVRRPTILLPLPLLPHEQLGRTSDRLDQLLRQNHVPPSCVPGGSRAASPPHLPPLPP